MSALFSFVTGLAQLAMGDLLGITGLAQIEGKVVHALAPELPVKFKPVGGGVQGLRIEPAAPMLAVANLDDK